MSYNIYIIMHIGDYSKKGVYMELRTIIILALCIFALLLVLVIECLKTAYWAKNISGRLIATGMAALIGFQSFINIGVATEILPNTGLPLPFLSYGLTSLLSCMAGIGMVLNVGLQRHY